MRVPLVIGGAGLPKDKRSEALCYLYDLFPTLCDLTEWRRQQRWRARAWSR